MWMMMAAAAAGAASPTYLSCYLEQETRQLPVEIIADEANRRATISLPTTGRTVERLAIFAPAEVRIADDETDWRIDRVTLDFQRTMSIGGFTASEYGKCEVKPEPATRAF